jgi:hypothetical protein
VAVGSAHPGCAPAPSRAAQTSAVPRAAPSPAATTAPTVTCSSSGPSPDPVDHTLVPNILYWVASVEKQSGLSAANWQGQPAKAPTPAQTSLVQLQAVVRAWANAARPGTVDAIFREAVGHGVNVEYEVLMVREDPSNASDHQFWADTEAARASACLSLIRQP